MGDQATPLERIHVEVGQNLVHDSGIDLLAACSVPNEERIEAQVVNVPRNAFAVRQNPFKSPSGEQRPPPVTSYLKPVFDVPNGFRPRKWLQATQD